MPALFATFLLLSLLLAGAAAFVGERSRPRLKALLVVALVLAWVSLGVALAQILARTASTLVTPGGARQPHLIGEAGREALVLLLSLGGPAVAATGLAWLALRTTRPLRQKP